jgi:membrane protein
VQIKRFARELARRFLDDHVLDLGAMLAYYAVLALFPMVVFVLAVAMLVVPRSVIDQAIAMAGEAVPAAVQEPLVARIDSFTRQAHGLYAVLGAAIALWGGRGGMVSLMGALDHVFHEHETRSWLHRQLVALLVTIGVAALVVLALALLVVGPIAGRWLDEHFGLGREFDVAWSVGRWIGAGLLVLVGLAILYKFLPDTKAPFRVFSAGTISAVSLWLLASWGFGLYLQHFNRFEATYGALGGAIIFLTWLWLTNIALLVGAEVDDVIAELRAGAPAATTYGHAHASS